MTPEQFDEFIWEIIPQHLFHVDKNDVDDDSGGRLEEVILVKVIYQNMGCLQYQPLQWFIDQYIPKTQS